MHIGIAKAAGVNFDDDLIGTGFGRLPLFHFPFAVNGRNDCCFHEERSWQIFAETIWIRFLWMLATFLGFTGRPICGAGAGNGKLSDQEVELLEGQPRRLSLHMRFPG
jgi:hypothetical protein